MDLLKPSAISKWQQTFASLKYRNFRLWFWGQLISLFGTWMQMTAQGFLIYELTHSSAYLGYVGFASGIPSWLLSSYGGVIADRIPRRQLLIATQLFMMTLALALSILTFTGIVRAWHILVLAFCLGIANAFDSPARLAFVSELVEREDITNAVALNATMFNTAIAIGPAAAGIIYASLGPAWCFAINSLTFIAIIFALIAMKIKRNPTAQKRSSSLTAIKEGFIFIHHQPIIRTLITIVAATALFGLALGTLLPAWSIKILNGDATTNGLLFSSRGIGSLLGALALAAMGRIAYRGRLISYGSLLLPVFIAIFTIISYIPLTFLIMGLIGIAAVFVLNLSNAMIQSHVPDELRGRVMGVYSTIFMGSIPLGSLLLGVIAEHTSEITAALISSASAFSIALFIWFFVPNLRNVE